LNVLGAQGECGFKAGDGGLILSLVIRGPA
jgi:hypothetical protein